MRRDPIFYQMFQRSPALLFDLIGNRPANATDYRFDSVATKEPKFEIDGVLLPPETEPGIVYFCEVQFQKDKTLYERLFSESFLYFYRHRPRFCDWHTVIIYPTRALEQDDTHPYRALLSSDQVHRVYLDELGDVRSLPIPVAATVLTIVEETAALDLARTLISRVMQEADSDQDRANLIDIVTSIMVYKFTHFSQAEIKAMISIIDFTKEPRAIREAKDEGRQEGQELALQRERSLILRLLTKRLGTVEDAMAACVLCLSFDHLEALGEALLDFTDRADLAAWIRGNLTWVTTPLTQQLGQDLPAATIVRLSTLPLAVLADLRGAIPEFTSVADHCPLSSRGNVAAAVDTNHARHRRPARQSASDSRLAD